MVAGPVELRGFEILMYLDVKLLPHIKIRPQTMMKITFFSFNKSAFWSFKCTSGPPPPFLYYHVQVFGTAGAVYSVVQDVPIWTTFEILRLSAWYVAVIAYSIHIILFFFLLFREAALHTVP